MHPLAALVKQYGGTPAPQGSVMGTVNRAWLNLRAAISSNSDLAVLEECERAEDAALRAYQHALVQDLPADVHSVVTLQFNGAKENHKRVRELRDEKRRIAA